MAQPSHNDSFRRATSDILPIVSVAGTEGVDCTGAFGTGFLIAPNLLITCWHCVRKQLPDGQRYAVPLQNDGSDEWRAYLLFDIERDRNDADLATAKIDLLPRLRFSLATKELGQGEDVWSFGYPLPSWRETGPGQQQLVLPRRLLKGYVMRSFLYQHPAFGGVASYELDMPTPQGLSGGPLVRVDSKDVHGVVFGSHDVETIEELASVDPTTGHRTPEVQRKTSFGLALHTSILCELRTGATNDLPLSRFLAEGVK